MVTEAQRKYITDLAILKTKEFKEIKEMLVAHDIVGEDSQTVKDAPTLAAILDALTQSQASRLIDVLTSKKDPVRGQGYSDKRVAQVTALLDEIIKEINSWKF